MVTATCLMCHVAMEEGEEPLSQGRYGSELEERCCRCRRRRPGVEQEQQRRPEIVVYLSATRQTLEVKIGSVSVSNFRQPFIFLYCTELLNALIGDLEQ